MFTSFSVLLLLQIFVASEVTGKNECTFKGQTYDNLATFPHDNGCAILQCQFGQIVTFYEACGKDIDGTCHRLNFMFENLGTTYQCRKVQQGAEFVYVNEIAVPRVENCTDDGKIYQTLQKFRSGNDCREYQCQNGQKIPLDPMCGKDVDGKCHLLGETFELSGIVYNCTSREENGEVIFENKFLDPQPSSRQQCVNAQTSYQNYQIFRILPLCHLRQCQDKRVKIIIQQCAFKRDDIQCFQEGEEWQYENKTYRCNYDTVKQQMASEVVNKGYGKCKRAEKWYYHLEVHTRLDGCTSVQCQDGKTLPVQEGCLWNVDNKCHELNSEWQAGSVVLKCILTEDGLYRVVELDENGNVIDRVVTTAPPPVFEQHCPALMADIIFVLDSSGSIVSTAFKNLLKFVATFVSAFTIGPLNVRFGVIVFSGNASLVFGLADYNDLDSLQEAISKIPFLGDITNTHLALNLISDNRLFGTENGGRAEAPNAVIVITDGNSTYPDLTLEAADRVKDGNASIFVVGVGHINKVELYGIASQDEYVFGISSYEDLFSVIQILSGKTCEVITNPKDPLCPNATADVIFILDASSGVGSENFEQKLDLAINVTREFTISPEKVQVGVVLIASEVKNLFDLNRYSDGDAVAKALKEAPYLEGDRDTADALNLVLDDGLFTAHHGGRANVAKIAVLIIDGPSSDIIQSSILAESLRNRGVTIVVVGIDNYNLHEVNSIAGDAENVFLACSYNQFNDQRRSLAVKICEAANKPPPVVVTPEPAPSTPRPSPGEPTREPPTPAREKPCAKHTTTAAPDIKRCLSGDANPCQQICTNTNDGFTCSCNEGYEVNSNDSTQCVVIPCTRQLVADIIFVTDSSDSIGATTYPKALGFVADLIDSFRLDKGFVRVGALIYSWNVVKLFDLEDYTDSTQIRKVLLAAPYLDSSTYTHSALSYIDTNNMFGVENGGRDDAAKLVVLQTDGKSAYSDLTIRFANILKAKGIRIICIGIGKKIDKKELTAVASSPKDVYYVSNYDVLQNIEADVSDNTCKANPPK